MPSHNDHFSALIVYRLASPNNPQHDLTFGQTSKVVGLLFNGFVREQGEILWVRSPGTMLLGMDGIYEGLWKSLTTMQISNRLFL